MRFCIYIVAEAFSALSMNCVRYLLFFLYSVLHTLGKKIELHFLLISHRLASFKLSLLLGTFRLGIKEKRLLKEQ